MIITIGFTESDRSGGYSSFSDGYHIGARQTSVTLALDGDGLLLTGEEWAEEAFVASNHPGEAPAGPARAIQCALAEQVPTPLRSLSFPGERACCGWWWSAVWWAGRHLAILAPNISHPTCRSRGRSFDIPKESHTDCAVRAGVRVGMDAAPTGRWQRL